VSGFTLAMPASVTKIRLLAVDLDGTLLRADKVPHPASAEALRRAEAAGITVVIASGRALPAVRLFTTELGLHGPCIGANGADVSSPDGVGWRHDRINGLAASALVIEAHKRGLTTAVYGFDRVYLVRRSGGPEPDFKRIIRTPTELVNEEDVASLDIGKVLVMQDPAISDETRAALMEVMDSRFLRSTDSEPHFMEFLAVGTSKASALQEVGHRLGIPASQTAAIGDYLNDLEMVEYAEIGAAMGNGHSALRAAANLTVATNEDGGVAEFVNLLCAPKA